MSVSTEDPSLSVVVGEDDMLRAFTTYSITVAAVSDVSGSSEDSQPTTVTTTQTSRIKHSLTYNYVLLKICELSVTQILQQLY